MGDIQHTTHTRANTMTTTIIIAAMLTAIILPIIILGTVSYTHLTLPTNREV